MSSDAVDAARGPIFVLGAMGSGTTLMRLILDSHPDIAMAQETGFARALTAEEWIPYYQSGEQWFRRIGWSPEDFQQQQREFYTRLFARFAEQRGAVRWGDKTPTHVWHVERLARVFPDAQFVGMVRHPGATANSRSHRMGHTWSSSLRQWSRRNTELLCQAAQLGDRFALVRYEDLVTSPEPVLRELLAWLGVPWSDQVLAFHEVHRERGTPSQVEGYTLSDEPIDARRLDAWTGQLTPQRAATLTRGRVRRLSRLLGYRPGTAAPTARWASDAWCLTGAGVARRMADSRIDWSRRPRPPMGDRPLDPRELLRLQRAARAATRPDSAWIRADRRLRGLGHRVLAGLPPRPRRRVRAAYWRLRSWLARRAK